MSALKAQLQDKKQTLINLRRSAHGREEAERERNLRRERRLDNLRRSAIGYRDEAEREGNRLAQELLEVRAGNETLVRDLKNALQQKEKKESAWAELLKELGSKNQKLELKDQELISIQDSAAMDSRQLLSVDEAELVEEGCQDDWKTKVWRSLARFLMLGSYLLGAAAEFFPQEQALLPDLGPSSYQLRQGGAEQIGEGGQDTWRTKAWRSVARSFMLGSYLQAIAVDTRAVRMVVDAFKARRSNHLPMVRKFQLEDQLATTKQELSTVEAPNRRPPMHHPSPSPPTNSCCSSSCSAWTRSSWWGKATSTTDRPRLGGASRGSACWEATYRVPPPRAPYRRRLFYLTRVLALTSSARVGPG